MSKAAKLLVIAGRPEFLPANSASLIIGWAWGLSLPVDIISGLAIPLLLSFAVITLVAAFAAHINTLSDYKLDTEDETKKNLVEAVHQLGGRKLKRFMIIELSLGFALLLLLAAIKMKPALFAMWIAAVFLAFAYSAQPLRLKSRSFLAPITLMIVLSILPVTFVAYVFTATLGFPYWVFLVGQAITVYAVIIPAEIRDYFGDKVKGVVTMTVQLGLKNASLLGLTLLSLGGILCGAGFILELSSNSLQVLSVFLLVMSATYLYVLLKYLNLYKLSKNLNKQGHEQTEQNIVEAVAKNPKWITLITQSIVVMSVVLLVSKII